MIVDVDIMMSGFLGIGIGTGYGSTLDFEVMRLEVAPGEMKIFQSVT